MLLALQSRTAAEPGLLDGRALTVILVVCGLLALLAAIDLLRRPARLALGGRRWPWTLIILVLVGLGWILWLLFGRLSEQDLLEQEELSKQG